MEEGMKKQEQRAVSWSWLPETVPWFFIFYLIDESLVSKEAGKRSVLHTKKLRTVMDWIVRPPHRPRLICWSLTPNMMVFAAFREVIKV